MNALGQIREWADGDSSRSFTISHVGGYNETCVILKYQHKKIYVIEGREYYKQLKDHFADNFEENYRILRLRDSQHFYVFNISPQHRVCGLEKLILAALEIYHKLER